MNKKLISVATISMLLGASAGSLVDANAAVELLLVPKTVSRKTFPLTAPAIVSLTSSIRSQAELSETDVLGAACFVYDAEPGRVLLDVRAKQELAIDTSISPAIKDLNGVTVKP